MKKESMSLRDKNWQWDWTKNVLHDLNKSKKPCEVETQKV